MSPYFGCEGQAYLAEENARRLGNVTCGKSCVRFRNLENLEVALERIERSAAGWCESSGS